MKRIKQLLCRHEWEHLIRPNDFFSLMICSKCGKIEQHRPKKRYIFTKKANRLLYCWCPNCRMDLVKDSYEGQYQDIVHYKCSWCGHDSKWLFGPPVPILIEGGSHETE